MFFVAGVAPPNQRNESHFDAGAKFHVASGSTYVEVAYMIFLAKWQLALKLL